MSSAWLASVKTSSQRRNGTKPLLLPMARSVTCTFKEAFDLTGVSKPKMVHNGVPWVARDKQAGPVVLAGIADPTCSSSLPPPPSNRSERFVISGTASLVMPMKLSRVHTRHGFREDSLRHWHLREFCQVVLHAAPILVWIDAACMDSRSHFLKRAGRVQSLMHHKSNDRPDVWVRHREPQLMAPHPTSTFISATRVLVVRHLVLGRPQEELGLQHVVPKLEKRLFQLLSRVVQVFHVDDCSCIPKKRKHGTEGTIRRRKETGSRQHAQSDGRGESSSKSTTGYEIRNARSREMCSGKCHFTSGGIFENWIHQPVDTPNDKVITVMQEWKNICWRPLSIWEMRFNTASADRCCTHNEKCCLGGRRWVGESA